MEGSGVIDCYNGGFYVQLRYLHQGREAGHPDYYRRINLEYRSRCDGCFFTPRRPNLHWRHTFVPLILKPGCKVPRIFFQCDICKNPNEQIEVVMTPPIICALLDKDMDEELMKKKLVEVYGKDVFSC